VRRGDPKLQTWCRECFAAYGVEYYRKNREAEKARSLRNIAATRTENRRRMIDYLREHPCVDCGETDIVVLEFDHVGEKLADISTYANGGRTWERVAAEIAKCEVRCANCHRRKTSERAAALQHMDEAVEEPAPVRSSAIQLRIDAALGVRACRVCGLTKPLSEFPFRSLRRQTRQWICLLCQREYTNTWYAENRQRQIANSRKRSGRTTAQLRRLVREYLLEHPCVDCGESDPGVLDFDHLRDKRANISQIVQSGLSWNALWDEIEKCEVRCANCHRRRTAQLRGYYRTLAAGFARIDAQTP
jgi:hypothetical protein